MLDINPCIALSIKHSKKDLAKNKYLNLPDLMFMELCKTNYGVNRGVYNTIDHWFYEEGINVVTIRRLFILSFLDTVIVKVEGTKSSIKFGHGGLSKKLNEFMKNHI
ncbi:hypothetical protein [Halalkalibacter alkalisediminis]|uniref:Uncharacterized protein n=1 Tax=Halalkalibacter alkalisediminis TaxID=935616 RepID=A0ABV6NDN0_9BACI|nr:hypothetical protein [Halalkalibacter alkalisediminis]